MRESFLTVMGDVLNVQEAKEREINKNIVVFIWRRIIVSSMFSSIIRLYSLTPAFPFPITAGLDSHIPNPTTDVAAWAEIAIHHYFNVYY